MGRPGRASALAAAFAFSSISSTSPARAAPPDEAGTRAADPSAVRPAYLELDLRAVALAHAPPLTMADGAGKSAHRIPGFPDPFAAGGQPIVLTAAHVAVRIHPGRHVVLPILGLSLGGAASTYRDFDAADRAFFGAGSAIDGAIDLPGFGLEARTGPWALSATARPFGYFVSIGGQARYQNVARDVTANGGEFMVRVEARACWHESPFLALCGAAGPNLGLDGVNGVTVSLGIDWAGRPRGTR
jgi:hypothetical protein